MRLQAMGAQSPLGKGLLDPLGFSGPLCVSCHPLDKLQVSRIPSKGRHLPGHGSHISVNMALAGRTLLIIELTYVKSLEGSRITNSSWLISFHLVGFSL